MRNLLSFLGLLLVVVNPILLNGQQFTFRHLGLEEGLPATTVNRITQDPNGVFWIATEGGGIARYDGNSMTILDVEDGLPSNFVSHLELIDDLMWIGTEKGVCAFDGKNLISLDSIKGAPESRVYDILETDAGIYLATATGLFLYEKDGFRKTAIKGSAYCLAEFEGDILTGTSSGLYRGDKIWMVEGIEVRSIEVKGTELRFSAGSRILDQNGEVWFQDVGTVRDIEDRFVVSLDRGLIETGNRGQFREYEARNGLSPEGFRCLYRDDRGVLWIGGFQGVYQFLEPGIGRFRSKHGLVDERIWSLGIQNDRILLGSMGELMGIDMPPYGIGAVNLLGLVSNGLPEGIIFEIQNDPIDPKTLWLGTEKGLVRRKSETSVLFRGPVDLANDFFVFDLLYYKEEWIVASSNGLYGFQEGEFRPLVSKELSPFGGFFSLVEYEGKVLALSPSGEGFTWDGKQAGRFEVNSLLDSLTPSSAEVVNDELLIGTYGGGIYRYDGQSMEPFPNREEHIDENILSIRYDLAQTIYVATDKGIRIWEQEPSGRWRSVRLLGEREGIPLGKMNPQAVAYQAMGDLGILWWGSSEGVIYLDERRFRSGPTNPGARIQKVELNLKGGQWAEAGWPFGGWGPGPESPRLEYDQNYFRFEFSSPSEVYGREVQYRYRLKGLSDEWTPAGERHEAVFTSLPDGDYEFQLEVRWPDQTGSWYPAVPFSFHVSPPFWLTWWFFVLVVSTIGVLIYLGLRFRIRQINKRVAMQNRLAELEGQALRLQMNPHFIFNALESINGFIFKNDQKQATQYLNRFAKLMRLTLESSREHKIPLQTETQILQNYLSLEQLRFSGSFEYEIQMEEDLDPYAVMLPPMLIQPLCENAILHGLRPMESGGFLRILFKHENEELRVIVEDNGIGRQKASEMAERISQHRSMATEITNERLQLLRQKEDGEFRLDIQDLFDPSGKPAGTRVILSLPFESEDF